MVSKESKETMGKILLNLFKVSFKSDALLIEIVLG